MMNELFRRILAIVLIFALILPFSQNAFAVAASEEIANQTGWKVIDFEEAKLFVEETDEKKISVGADSDNHLITVSIAYSSEPNSVYQWIFYDYPVSEYDFGSYSFWKGAVEYAEARLTQGTIVHFSSEKRTEEARMMRSSATADLLEHLETIVGLEHSDQHIDPARVIDGHLYNMYETLTFSVVDVTNYWWNAGITLSTLVVSILGHTATNPLVREICAFLGYAFDGLDMLVNAGSMAEYRVTATYYRYIRIDGGSSYYANAYKVISYTGYEDTSTASRERAALMENTRVVTYSHSEAYFNSGIFDAAHEAYLLGG